MTKVVENTMTIRDAMNYSGISLIDFYNALHDIEVGYWDGVNSREIIEQYCCEMIRKGIRVSHIVRALESSYADIFGIWLGNSMDTPTPIQTKEELVEALYLDDEQLDMSYEFNEED